MINLLRKLCGSGCATCGGGTILPFDVSKSSKVFTGHLLKCSTCGLVYSDFLLINDRGQITPDPVVAAAKGGQKVVLNDYNNMAHIIPDTRPPRTNSYHVVLGPRFHGDMGFAFITEIIYGILCTQNLVQQKRITQRVSIGIEGYNDDSREIWEIAEVVQLFSRLREAVPGLALWLTNEYQHIYFQVLAAGADDHARIMTEALLQTFGSLNNQQAPQVPSDYTGKARFFPLVTHAAMEAKVQGDQCLHNLLQHDHERAKTISSEEAARIDRTLDNYKRA